MLILRVNSHPDVSFLAFRHILRHVHPDDDSFVVEQFAVTLFLPANVLGADPRIFEWVVLDDILTRLLRAFLVSETALGQPVFRNGFVRVVFFVLMYVGSIAILLLFVPHHRHQELYSLPSMHRSNNKMRERNSAPSNRA